MEKVGYQKLIVYKKANDLVLLVHKATKKFLSWELFGLSPQGSVAEYHFYCNFQIAATALPKLFDRYAVYASQFLLHLARNLEISLRKPIRQ